ncbi:FHA domain-containing protein [Janibacter sp. G1551]|uniref:FHA domain-containing protein n=1 Tax=Janibacter sp. G1551 TaxID=3420440 RepID=UPI003D055327
MSDSGNENQGPARQDPATQRIPGTDPSTFEAPRDTDAFLTRDEQATVDALRPGTALLIVLRGPNTGARFLLDDAEVTSGRGPDSDIFLDDVTVSRKHAVFSRGDQAFSVRDVGSLNGTYVNRERIDSADLRTGDEVQIGKFRLVFYAGRD